MTRATAKPLFCAALITLPARCTAPGLTTQSVDCLAREKAFSVCASPYSTILSCRLYTVTTAPMWRVSMVTVGIRVFLRNGRRFLMSYCGWVSEREEWAGRVRRLVGGGWKGAGA